MAGVSDAILRMRESARSEPELLSLAKRGNLDAFDALVRLHERRIYGLALRLTGSPEDAKDATQEAFVRLFRNLGRVNSEQSPGAWLCTVAVNACRDIGRVRRRSRLVPMGEKLAVFADPAADPETLRFSEELEDGLRQCLQKLPEKEREALILRELEGLSTQQVAEVLGSSESTVRVQVASARIKLRKLLAARFEGKV